MKKFIIGRLKSMGYALQGFWLLVRTEDAIITHSIGCLLFVGLGLYFGITPDQWMFQLLAFGQDGRSSATLFTLTSIRR